MKSCSYCGADNDECATHCFRCGSDVSAEQYPLANQAEREALRSLTPAPQFIPEILFSFHGRISRSTFWLTWIAVRVLLFMVMRLAVVFELEGMVAICMIPMELWIAAALYVKRWHDRNQSGWMSLILLVPVAGPLWGLVELGCLSGTVGPNRYGQDPLGRHEVPGACEEKPVPT